MEARLDLPKGTLHVVATPIGNLGDITLRAVQVLGAVRLVVAEDTRHTGLLLAHLGIKVPQLSYHAHNRRARLPRILGALGVGDVALVTDAGTPSISDPGQELVAAARAAGHEVVAVPGPSALAAAMMVSGIAADAAHFIGFLPRRASERRRTLASVAAWPGAVIFFEAPHRLVEALEDAVATLGDREAAACNDLTKRFERVSHGRLSELVREFRAGTPRGEFTVVVAPAPAIETQPARMLLDHEVHDRLATIEEETGDRREALRRLAAETGLPRKALYAAAVRPSSRESRPPGA